MKRRLSTVIAMLGVLGLVAPLRGQAPVSGTYRANGKDAKLAHAVAVKREAFSGREAVTIVLSEKDPGRQEKPDFVAGFGELGSALVVSITKDGSVFSCQVAHAALKHMGASTSGQLKVEGFAWDGGKVRGRLTTGGPAKLFDESWEADLTFEAKAP